MSNKLKKCPFCGGDAYFYAGNGGGIKIICSTCECQTSLLRDEMMGRWPDELAMDKIKERWNTRNTSRPIDDDTECKYITNRLEKLAKWIINVAPIPGSDEDELTIIYDAIDFINASNNGNTKKKESKHGQDC